MAYILPDDMRVGVNLLFMVPGEVGGSEPYVTNLVANLASEPVDLTIFAVKGFSQAYPEIANRCDVVEVPWSSGAQGLRIMAEHSWIAYEAKKRRLEMVHHGGGTAPFMRTLPSLVTVHDIQFRHYPKNFVKPKRWWLEFNVPNSIKKCTVTCVVSNWVKNDILEKMDADADKIRVVPFGREGLVGTPDVEQVRTRFELRRDFVFYPSRTYPHKNHLFLLEAFAPLAGEIDLVLTGPPWFRDPLIAEAADRLGISRAVRHLGQVQRDDLASLYSASVALVYPSKFEGFGAPALEAMSLGCPVIASNITAIPEVVGSGGILLNPSDHEDWRNAMRAIVDDAGLRGRLRDSGLARAATFTWQTSVSAQMGAYRKALAWAE